MQQHRPRRPAGEPGEPAETRPAARPELGAGARPGRHLHRRGPGNATEIAPGIGECELVRLKGKPPTDVLVGESGRGQREVQVLYTEPGAKELYFFINNRLDRIVK